MWCLSSVITRLRHVTTEPPQRLTTTTVTRAVVMTPATVMTSMATGMRLAGTVMAGVVMTEVSGMMAGGTLVVVGTMVVARITAVVRIMAVARTVMAGQIATGTADIC